MSRTKFKLQQGESLITQGKNELHITGKGSQAYLWIGGNGCYATLSGMKTLETLAASIYRALGHEPMRLHRDKIKELKKSTRKSKL
jgi:hypothetical protein